MNPTVLLVLALGQVPAGAAPTSPAPRAATSPAPDSPAGPVLTLADALHRASEANLDLQVAQARLDQAHEIARKVWAAYLPQISIGGSYTRNNIGATIALPTGYAIRNVGQPTGPPNNPSQPTGISNPPGLPTTDIAVPSGLVTAVIQKLDQVGAQANLSQALVVPALWPAIQNAYRAEHLAELNVEVARREVLYGVAQLYFGAAGLQQAVQITQRVLALNLDHENDARARVEAGASPRLLLIRAQLDRARAEEDVKRSQNSYRSARVALATMLDRAPDFEVALPPDLPAQPNGDLEARALSDRPDLIASAASLDLARRTRAAIWYQYLPTLGLQAQYRIGNVKGFTGTYDAWAITLGLNWVIYEGGLRESAAREDEAKVREAELTQRSQQNQARADVQRALIDLDSARANRAKAEEQLQLAKENMALVKVNVDNGVATPIDFADANNALESAELGLVGETLNANLAAMALSKAVGAFDPR